MIFSFGSVSCGREEEREKRERERKKRDKSVSCGENAEGRGTVGERG